ncbi:ribonuclease HII [Salinibacillus xinjiangensis]|uniref:Ribonuclease HII n=1 Tax=Salinibacillus xinjiangensis TaxID=1229268 RepID=A0A6G1X366_9BACI|nr:ribonuclease HII [Salinibacillus xinjiangensis]MRG85417.1 ribonuclease HII [Salinibacillus xinjiangensis]
MTIKSETIAVIREKIENETYTVEEWNAYTQDERKGVQVLVKKQEKRRKAEQLHKEQFEEMLTYEKSIWHKGSTYIAGIDEAGRGPLAGPVVAGAVIINDTFYLEGINDSKKLSVQARERYFDQIKQLSVSYGIGIVDNNTIDQINIFQATKLAMKKAVADLSIQPDHLLVDAVQLNEIPIHHEAIIKGDQKSVSIAAASIIAKVTRDRLMRQVDEQYPAYQFASNMGYGTKNHLQALKQFGPTPYHRVSFAPVKDAIRS